MQDSSESCDARQHLCEVVHVWCDDGMWWCDDGMWWYMLYGGTCSIVVHLCGGTSMCAYAS